MFALRYFDITGFSRDGLEPLKFYFLAVSNERRATSLLNSSPSKLRKFHKNGFLAKITSWQPSDI